ncbi:hypothetical protein [Spirilliplanes yamanashiensis]|uniref:Ribosomally synthesized peptide with SipW-like signal peptide n=1 Tax=Spirilliplanes yamanashiensis TaxID=42233 RepID=A0A8J3Y835_9ACTN|nr:hypothetical protein [Spirilliplanes yamanashiensis]MDP9815457.1 hypothetical protein [Spirilliplanes yamanashiensis]GIJ03711.1 hypothetical protein Sya03_30630 [Spirilliplanes yamanashiensis]
MNLNKKRTAVLSGVAAIGVAVAGTVAWAAFTNSQTASAGAVQSETYQPLTVSGEFLGRTGAHSSKALLPGDTGDVRLTLTNPAGNSVNGKVVSIRAEQVNPHEVTGGATWEAKQGCAAAVQLSDISTANGNTVILAAGSTQPLTLVKALKLADGATLACSGMTFPLNYTVTFEATRDGAVLPANSTITS